ncbi:MAG: NYN domain-containing protein [Streptosporangiaceae bacterium]
MDRCALFVDASYVLADGALAVHGTRNRDSVSWDYAGLLKLLGGLSRDRTGLQLLRCYWYDAAADGNRAAEHDFLADVPGVKLRLSKARPNRKEGVEAEIRKDLTALARNRAVSDVIIVSGEEDLAPVIAEVQDLGIRTVLLNISADGDWAVSRALRQECDDIIDIAAGHLRPYVDLIPGAEPEQVTGAYREMGTGAAQVSGPHQAIEAPAARMYGSPLAAEYDRAEPQLAGLGAGGRDQREQVPGLEAGRFAGQRSLGGPTQAMGSGPGQRISDPQSLGQQYQSADPSRGQLPGTASQGGFAPNAFAPHDAANGQAGNGRAGQLPNGLGQRGGVDDNRGQGGQPPGMQPGHMAAAGLPAGFAGQAGVAGGGMHAPGGGLPAAAGQLNNAQSASQANGMPGNGVSAGGMPANGQAGPGGQLGGPAGGGHGQGPMSQPGMSQPAMPQGGATQGGMPHGTMAQGNMAQANMPGGSMPGGMAGGIVQGSVVPGSGLGQNGNQHPSAGQPGGAGSGPPGQGLPMPPGQPQGIAPHSQGISAPGQLQGMAPHSQGIAAPGQLQGMAPHSQGIAAPGQHGLQRPGSGPGLPPGGMPAGHGPADQQRQQPQQRQLPAGNGVQYPQDRGQQYGGPAQTSPYAGSPVSSGYPAGPYGAQQPAPVPAPPVAISVAEAVQSAHAEGFGFGEAVARDAPALWLEAVLARKPRMPSDLEARLLQGSALPIDSLLHDEVRHALRRGFWDALERSRH